MITLVVLSECRLKCQQLFKRLKRTNDEDGDNKALGKSDKMIKSCERDLLCREQGRVAFGESRRLFIKHHVFGWDGIFCRGSPGKP